LINILLYWYKSSLLFYFEILLLDTVRQTFELDFDLEALRSNGSLNVTRFLEVLDLEEGVLEELVESHGLPYNLRRLARFFWRFV